MLVTAVCAFMSVFIAEIQPLATDVHAALISSNKIQHSKFSQQIYAHSPKGADKKVVRRILIFKENILALAPHKQLELVAYVCCSTSHS